MDLQVCAVRRCSDRTDIGCAVSIPSTLRPGGGKESPSDATKLTEALLAAVANIPLANAAALLAQLSSVTMALSARLAIGIDHQAAGTRPVCLSLAELAHRLRLGQSTIRKMVEAGEFVEGIHFTRLRRRLIFRWAPIEQRLGAQSAPPSEPQSAEAVPFVRRARRRG